MYCWFALFMRICLLFLRRERRGGEGRGGEGEEGEGRGGRGRGGKGREEKRRPLVVNVRSHRRVMKNGVYSSLSKLFEKNKKHGSI